MKIWRLGRLSAALILALASLLTIPMPVAQATGVTYYWCGPDGQGATGDMATAHNWDTAADCSGHSSNSNVPGNNDLVVFDASNQTGNVTLMNTGAFELGNGGGTAAITFSGNTNGGGYTLTGNALGLDGNIVAGSGSNEIDNIVHLEVNSTITGTGDLTFGDSSNPTTLDMAGFNLTVGSGSDSEQVIIPDNMNNSGDITAKDGTQVDLQGNSPGWTGNVDVKSGALVTTGDVNALGNASNVFTVESGGMIFLYGLNGTTVPQAFTIAGNGFSGGLNGAVNTLADQSSNGSATFTGTLTLTADSSISADGTVTVNGPIAGNFNLNAAAGMQGKLVVSSSNNQSQTANGTYEAPVQTITVASGDNQAGLSVTVGKNQTYVIDGTRGSVDVENGGTLKGTGTVGTLTVENGGVVAPGHSPGCLGTGSLTLTGTYQVEIGGTTACSEYDQLNVTGTVDVSNGKITATIVNGFVPKVGQSFTIINNDASDAVTGTFQGIAEGGSYTNDGVTYSVTYKGGDGNDVVLTVTAVDASLLPKTPNTGFQLIATHPLVSLLATTLAAGSLVLASRQLKPVARKK